MPRKMAYGPMKILSPGLILTGTLGAMRLPPTCVPLVLPKSVTASMPSGGGRHAGVPAGDLRIRQDDVQAGRAPDDRHALPGTMLSGPLNAICPSTVRPLGPLGAGAEGATSTSISEGMAMVRRDG